jgi:hypothetical protein
LDHSAVAGPEGALAKTDEAYRHHGQGKPVGQAQHDGAGGGDYQHHQAGQAFLEKKAKKMR